MINLRSNLNQIFIKHSLFPFLYDYGIESIRRTKKKKLLGDRIMVEFKVVVNDIQTGKSYNIPVSGHHANSLIGKKINDEVDGIFVSLPGYKLKITGGTDKDGFPMRHDIPGSSRRRLLLSKGVGFKPQVLGKRKKKSVRGNTINQEIVQVNMKVMKPGAKPIEEIIKDEGKTETKEAGSSKEKKEEQ
jgi:small subunit ribosomal protein S6e